MNALLKLLYRLYRLFTRVGYWTQRRFTHAGLAVLVALVASGMMGVDTDNTVAYQAFCLLLFLLLVSVAFSWSFRARFGVTRLLPRFGTVGQPLPYTVLIRNITRNTQTGLTLLEDLADPRPSYSDWLSVQLADQKRLRSFRLSPHLDGNPFKIVTTRPAPVPTLRSRQEVSVSMELTPLRRGMLRFMGVTLARPDPLGLFHAFKPAPVPQTVLVLPRRYHVPPLGVPGDLKYQEGGIALASSVGQSDEFIALRDYRHGDPMRHIHWRTWARAGKPVVKEFEDEFFVRHALILDTFTDHPYSEVFEEAVSVAASFAWTLQTQESLLDLLFVGPESFCFTAGRGLAQADQMLEILASVKVCRDHPFSSLEHLVLNHLGVVSGCICVLMAWDEPRRSLVQKLKQLGVPVRVLVITRPGSRTTLDPGPMEDEPEKLNLLEAGRIEQGLATLA